MRHRLLLILCFLYFSNIYCQQQNFKIFQSDTHTPLKNVSVINTDKIIAVSDLDGNFKIDISLLPLNVQLVAVGFNTRSFLLNIRNKEQIIYLSPTFEILSEVIVKSVPISKSLQQTPASVGIITSTDFKNNDPTTILESFNNVPGLFVNQGALNTNKITIRGVGARSQYSTNRIQAYFDGISLTSAEGELTLDDFDQETLDRVEIIKGPTSSIYGAGLGGSINLYSNNSFSESSKISSDNHIGSFNTQKHSLQTIISSKTTILAATLTNLSSDGYRDNGNYKRQSALFNGSIKTDENGKLSFLVNFSKLKAYIPSSLNKDDFINHPQSAALSWKDSQGFESYDRGLVGISYANKLSKNFKNITSIFLGFRDAYEPRPFDILKEESISAGVRTKFNLAAPIFKKESEVSFGVEYYNEWYEIATFKNLYKEYPNQGSVLGSRLSNNKQDRSYTNLFAQANMQLTNRWSIEAGLNINLTKYNLTDLFVDDSQNQTGNYRFNTIISPRIASSYQIAEAKNIYASISRGFSTPSVAETLTPEGQINTNLQPEIGINYELGFKGSWINKKLYTELSLFSIQIDNLLVAQRVAEDRYIGINAGKTDHNGIEFQTSYQLEINSNVAIKPYLNISLNFFEFDQFINKENDFSGNKLPGIPQYTTNIGIKVETKMGLTFYTALRSVGAIELNDANTEQTDPYNLFNLKASYNLKILRDLNLNIYSGVNNVFNQRYASSILTNAVGFGNQLPRYYYPGNPINCYAGLQLNYNL